MAFTVERSSDIVGGILALVLAAAGYTISSFAYPRLMGKSALDAARGGKAIEASRRSMSSIRNWFGFWTISLTILSNLLALSMEFGLRGFSTPVTAKQSAVILGGGRRFANLTADDGLFMQSSPSLPTVFAAAVGGCYSLETFSDFKMITNHYPAIDMSQNSSGTYVSSYDLFECTSSWLGSAEWTVESAGNLTIDLDTVTEQYSYEGLLEWTPGVDYGSHASAVVVSISYGYGTSFRGEAASTTPVVLVNTTTQYLYDAEVTAISLTEENGQYVYSLSTSMEYASIGGTKVITGTFRRGHLRSSEYSMGGMVSVVMLESLIHRDDSLSGMYSLSEIWWESEATSGDSIVHSNPEGSEQAWPSLSDSRGNLYTEYKKATRPIEYPFKVGETEATRISSWVFVHAAILAVAMIMLTVASLLVGNASALSTYDGLSRIRKEELLTSGKCANPKVFSLLGIVIRGDSEHIGLIRDDHRTEA